MIKSFVHKGLEKFYRTGSKAAIQASHSSKLRKVLTVLDQAANPAQCNFPGFRLHELRGARKGIWAITVQSNWRVTFRFTGEDVEIVNYEDYH